MRRMGRVVVAIVQKYLAGKETWLMNPLLSYSFETLVNFMWQMLLEKWYEQCTYPTIDSFDVMNALEAVAQLGMQR